MTETAGAGRVARVEFTGTRSDLFGLLFRGHVLMLPTIGLYRFWMVTWKRRFYWHNTVIDGDALEYSGRAIQLLVGFLFALGFFLPIYVGFFYLSTQSTQIAVIGYGSVAVVLWFLTGYAAYRGRDFRLSRTLWRGIRFDQRGNAWGYALRRFLWSLVMVPTGGLVYPWMCASLWRYRWRHTWYGDRQFSISGSWRQIAGPFFLLYVLYLVLAGALLALAGSQDNRIVLEDGAELPGPGFWFACVVVAFIASCGYFFFRARTSTRMFSTIRIGEAALATRVRARTLIGQFLLYSLALIGAILAFLLMFAAFAGSVVNTNTRNREFDPAVFAQMFQSGWTAVAGAILIYLALLAAFSILGETILGYGYWAAVARNATIVNPDSLRSVRATAEDKALAGEGLADALNVGAY
jgi:uncharacterized membrane protein YjgN (DUF898 family)